MAKVDLKSAYRSVALHPSQYQYTGLKWTFEGDSHPTYMYDAALSFGASLSPGIFHRLSQAVCRIMGKRGAKCSGYLDDFWVTAGTYAECNRILHSLLQLLRKLGFAISYKKVEGPAQCITFLGININSKLMDISLPQHKIMEYKELLRSFIDRPRASRRQLETLAGKLAWAANVVNGGRIYLQRVLAMLRPSKGLITKSYSQQLSKRIFSGGYNILTIIIARASPHIGDQKCTFSRMPQHKQLVL